MRRQKFAFTDQAYRQLQKLPRDITGRIPEKLRFFEAQKDPIIFSKPTPYFEHASFRYRIGHYRLICKLEGRDTITVVKVGARDKIYHSL